MKKQVIGFLLLLSMLITAFPLAMPAVAAAETSAAEAENYVDLDTLYVKDGLVSHFSTFGANASTVDLSAGTWTDLVAGKKASFDVKARWSVNSNGSVGFTSFYGTLDENGEYTSTSVGNNHTANVKLNFGLSLLPTEDYTVEYMAMYKPLYLYDADEKDHIARDAYGNALETFDYNMNTTGIFVHLLAVDTLGWFQNLASAIDGVIYKDWRSGLATDEELRATRSISHWTFAMNNGDAGGWYLDSSGRQSFWLGAAKVANGGLNVKGDVFQKNNVISTYAMSVDETVTDTGDTEAVFALYRDGVFYNSNQKQNDINTTAKGLADGGYFTDFDEAVCRFWLSCNRPTDFFSVRIYSRALTDTERKQNRAVDVLNYYKVKLPETYIQDTTVLARMFDLVADEVLVTDPLTYIAKAAEVEAKVLSCYPKFDTLDELYVKEGLVALYTAFTGDAAYLTETETGIVWQNRLYGGVDATFQNTGWTYGTERGGVGYDLIYGQIAEDGSFSSTYAGDTYANKNKLVFDLSLLPKEDFTLEYVARYTPHYCYDARVGALVAGHESGVSEAHAPNKIPSEPTDVIGFMASYTTRPGGNFPDAGGYASLRWRTVDAKGYKTWNADYGTGGYDFVHRASVDVEAYGLTRDESTTGEGDSLVTTAKYVHSLNGVSKMEINVSSATVSGKGRYFNYDDDTEFYLSYRLGTTFYAFRIYNRVLSEAEQRQNRAVDLLRYYDITIPADVLTDADACASIYAAAATQSFACDALEYAANKAVLQALTNVAIHRETLTDKFAQSEHLTALFTVYCPETVNLTARTWTDLVSGKTASFSVQGTNYWRVNANGSVGYTSFLGQKTESGLAEDAATNNFKASGNRLQLGLSLLPTEDFSVEFFAMYKPLYVYDASEADMIARNADGSKMESDSAFTREIAYKNLQVEHPIHQLGWFTGRTSILDSTSHYWKKENQLERGSVHWYFNCPDWYYESSTHQSSYVGGAVSHVPSAGLNITTDAYQQNNRLNTYGIYVDETLTVAEDGTRETTAYFGLYRNAKLYADNKNALNSTSGTKGLGYYDDDVAFSSQHNFWLSSTHASDFFTVRIYDVALTDAEKEQNHAIDLLLYYGITLTDEMWENETLMSILYKRVLEETATPDSLERAAISAELQAVADTIVLDLSTVNEMSALYAKSESLTALFTTEARSSVSSTKGYWRDYLGGNTATLGNASKGYWKIREDGAVGYDVIYGEIDGNGYGIYTSESAYNNYSDYGTRLEFGIDLLPKGDFTVEYLAEYRPVYAVDPNGTLAGEAQSYGASLPESQQYGQTQYVPVDFLGYLSSYTTRRDGVFSGRTYRGEVRWVVHEPVLPTSHWDYAYFTQCLSANADIFQTRNEIRAYGISRVKTTDASELVTAKYTLFRDTAQYAAASYSRKTYEDRVTSTASGAVPYNPPVITDFAKEDTGYFYLSERMSTDFYTVRIYNTALTVEDYERNRFVDLLYFYNVAIPSYLKDETILTQLASQTKSIEFGADPLSYTAGRETLLDAIDALEEISSKNTLYVQDGLVALYTAFVGDEAFLSEVDSSIAWQNRVLGGKSAVFENTGWCYDDAKGGVGYDLIYGQISEDGVFSASYTGNTYGNKNKLSLGLSLLPKEDFTLEYVALYKPHYCYDARTGELVEAYKSGVSGATTPNAVPSERVDVIGFAVSYSTHPGNIFPDAGGYAGLRWRTVDMAGIGTWSNEYGMGHDFIHRDGGEISVYGITRDETATGTGDSLVTTATYVHYLDLTAKKTINASSATVSGSGRYFNKDDDTDFYLSYRLGTTFYALRIYDRVLTAEERKQNRMADILEYYNVSVPKDFRENELRYEYVLSLCETLDFTQDEDGYNDIKKSLQTAVIGNDKQVTVTVGDQTETEIVYGDSYPLPKSVEGTNLFAWHKIDAEGNVLERYEPGAVVELTESETAFRALVLGSPETVYGVSVRVMPEDGFGMRFTSTVDKEEMKAIVDEYGGESIRLSILITPKAYVDRAGGFTREKLWNYVTANSKDPAHAFIEIQSSSFYKVDENVCTIAGTIYKFSDITIAKNPAFAAIGCIDVDTDGNGSFDKTVYGSFASSTARSPKKVVESIDYMGIQMTDTQKDWVDDFLKNYTERTYGNEGDKTVTEQRADIQNAFTAAMNTTVNYTVHAFAEGEVAEKYAHIQAISFDGLDSAGKKTRVFAYVGLPEGASPENPVPAMVLVHGGGGHAYMEWVRIWNERGYAAIAMETTGYFPASPGAWKTEGVAPTTTAAERALPDFICTDAGIDAADYTMMPLGNNRFTTTYTEVDEQWQYHGIASVILSHNVLRQNPAIDASRIGTTGVSWGGTLVSQVIGYDTRFAFAIPIYGTAYLGESERPFGAYSNSYVDDLWAAERNLNNFKNPILWFAWADDNNFVMSAYNKSYLHSRKNNPKTALVVLADWRHSHQNAWNQEHSYAFADSICFADAPAYATFVGEPSGQNATSQVLLPEGATNVSVRFHYLTQPMVYKTYNKYFESSWLVESWKTDNKTLVIDPSTGKITGTIPAGVRSYYISVLYTVNGKTFEVSSSFITIR